MGWRPSDEDSVALTLACVAPGAFRRTPGNARLLSHNTGCTCSASLGARLCSTVKHCVSCWSTVQSVTHNTDSDGLEERHPNPHVGECHSCAKSIFPSVEQLDANMRTIDPYQLAARNFAEKGTLTKKMLLHMETAEHHRNRIMTETLAERGLRPNSGSCARASKTALSRHTAETTPQDVPHLESLPISTRSFCPALSITLSRPVRTVL